MPHSEQNLIVALLSGGIAGTVVDLILFPLDTVKTRLQSKRGFWKSGGYRGIYAGIIPVALGSAPTAALFFATYEFVKPFGNYFPFIPRSAVYMGAASVGEVVACLVRVPVEVIKQRSQAAPTDRSIEILRRTLASEGFFGLYRGYWSTVLREIPFSLIQFPIWELLKNYWATRTGRCVTAWQSAVCGAIAGATAAGITTPLDVAKTRIMLSKTGSATARGYVGKVLLEVYAERGIKGLFAGILPRMAWISMGGALFLGTYEEATILIKPFFVENKTKT